MIIPPNVMPFSQGLEKNTSPRLIFDIIHYMYIHTNIVSNYYISTSFSPYNNNYYYEVLIITLYILSAKPV